MCLFRKHPLQYSWESAGMGSFDRNIKGGPARFMTRGVAGSGLLHWECLELGFAAAGTSGHPAYTFPLWQHCHSGHGIGEEKEETCCYVLQQQYDLCQLHIHINIFLSLSLAKLAHIVIETLRRLSWLMFLALVFSGCVLLPTVEHFWVNTLPIHSWQAIGVW